MVREHCSECAAVRVHADRINQVHMNHGLLQEAKENQLTEEVMTKCDRKTKEHLLRSEKPMP